MVSVFKIVLISSLAATWAASAAEVVSLGVSGEAGDVTLTLRLEGPISQGDLGRFQRAIATAEGLSRWDRRVLELNSPGGSYIEGLNLAAEIRRNGVETVVRSFDTCYSACALAFMGGAEWLRDVGVDPNKIPDQLPARSIESGAVVGFHAPYLSVPNAKYSAENVQGAYRMAVDSISALITLADHLYIESEELPRLLEPDATSAFLLDNVDAVRTLWVDYADYTLQTRDLQSITQTMVTSACINRWYHTKRRSALAGYAVAAQTIKDFDEGSELLGNDEAGKAFGVKSLPNGTVTVDVAYLPLAMTPDQKNFIWCVFKLDRDSPSVFYRSSGTVSELFEPAKGKGGLWELEQAEGTVRPESGLSISQGILRVLDMVPADTKLDEVEKIVRMLSQSEVSLLEVR